MQDDSEQPSDSPVRSTECSTAVAELLKDKKFMNRLAWRVSWEIVKSMLPWLLAIGAAFWLGSWMTMRLLLR
jgi:hypothetical protein